MRAVPRGEYSRRLPSEARLGRGPPDHQEKVGDTYQALAESKPSGEAIAAKYARSAGVHLFSCCISVARVPAHPLIFDGVVPGIVEAPCSGETAEHMINSVGVPSGIKRAFVVGMKGKTRGWMQKSTGLETKAGERHHNVYLTGTFHGEERGVLPQAGRRMRDESLRIS